VAEPTLQDPELAQMRAEAETLLEDLRRLVGEAREHNEALTTLHTQATADAG